MVRVKVRRVGNSLGFILPSDTAKELRVGEGDELFLTEAPGGALRITPYDPDFADAMAAAKSVMSRYRNALRELSK